MTLGAHILVVGTVSASSAGPDCRSFYSVDPIVSVTHESSVDLNLDGGVTTQRQSIT